MAGWDPSRVKNQLRLTSQRLGQMQSKKDSEGTITRQDIATLLSQGNLPLARAKAMKLVREDMLSDVLETLEMHIGVVLERFAELDTAGTAPSPPMVEAASSIIYAADRVDSKDLQISREALGQRLGPDFTRSAMGNLDKHVSARVLRGLNMPPPSAAGLDQFMTAIARSYGVNWSPPLLAHERLHYLSEILDPSSIMPIIDLSKVRSLTMPGLPAHPPWLRPRIWRLFFGTLPVIRADWVEHARKQRDDYYDLMKRLLEPFDSLPLPEAPPRGPDANLMQVYQQLSRVPPSLFGMLEDEPESPPHSDDTASGPPSLKCLESLDARLRLIQDDKSQKRDSTGTPEIRLEGTPEIRLEGTPEIRLEGDDDDNQTAASGSGVAPRPTPSRSSSMPTTLLHARPFASGNTNQRHTSALLRLLYIHACLNPGKQVPHIASILVPLYSTLQQEIEPVELVHAEADTFWLFEAVMSELTELQDEEEGNVWPLKLSARVAWADDELFGNLNARGLDPALPHYSYRWLAPLLSHTLPLECVLPIWDALFSRPERTRDSNPKIEHLVDICTSMLMRARTPLFALGKHGRKSPSLWSEENVAMPPPSPLRPWEAGDAFLEGITLLQQYPIQAAGGVDGILQTAMDLLSRREAELQAQRPALTLGARLRDTVWRGFTNQPTSPLPEVDEEEESDGEEEDIPPSDNEKATKESSGWASGFGSTVWRGITNQSAMDVPPSPIAPLTPVSPASRQGSLLPSPVQSRSVSPSPVLTSPPDQGSGLHPASASRVGSLWNYAAKLKDSDTAASLAKASSNWTAKAMDAWGNRTTNDSKSTASQAPSEGKPSAPTSPVTINLTSPFKRASMSSNGSQEAGMHSRNTSMSSGGQRDSMSYSTPPRPAFFKPVRDSFMPLPPGHSPAILPPLSPEASPSTSEGFMSKAKHLQDSLASLTGIQSPPPTTTELPKSGPRPLLLGGGSVVGQRRSITPTPSHQRQLSEAQRAPTPSHQRQYSESQHAPRPMHRDSASSASSLAPADAARLSTNWDSDSGIVTSRIVPLRRSVSPMAPTFRGPHSRTESVSSGGSGGRRGWSLVDGHDSPTMSNPDTPMSPPTMVPRRLRSPSNGSELSEGLIRIPPAPPRVNIDDMSDSSINSLNEETPSKNRKQRRPANLHIHNSSNSLLLGTAENDTLTPEHNQAPVDPVAVVTPRASAFDESGQSSPDVAGGAPGLTSGATIKRSRKVASRSNSGSGTIRRIRKASTGSRSPRRTVPVRDSDVEHGDDEGYEDLINAYDSEDMENVENVAGPR